MRNKKPNGCPYHEARCDRCTHKWGSEHCMTNNPSKCGLFIEHQEKREKFKIEALKSEINTKEKDHD